MKVVLLLDSLTPGGTETSTVALLPALVERGVEVQLVTVRGGAGPLAAQVLELGIPWTVLPEAGFVGRARAVRRLLREVRPDVLHTALFTADQLGRVAAIGLPVTVLASLVSTPYATQRMQDPSVRRTRLRAVQALDSLSTWLMVDHLQAVSEGVKSANARHLRIKPGKISVVHRGRAGLAPATTEERATTRARLGVPPGTALVITLGRQEPIKGQLVLLRAMQALVARRPGVRLHLFGGAGRATADIVAAATSSTLADVVTIHEHSGTALEALAAADVLVIPSFLEGTAGVALEAMALRTPIVSTDTAGTVGILRQGENALVVPIGDAEAMARAIAELLDDANLRERLVVAGEADFAARFTLDRASDELVALYGRLTMPT